MHYNYKCIQNTDYNHSFKPVIIKIIIHFENVYIIISIHVRTVFLGGIPYKS